MKKRLFNKTLNTQGFAISESMVAVSILGVLFLAIHIVMSLMNDMNRDNEIGFDLTNDVRLAIEKMIWGFETDSDPNNARDGIREAVSYQILGDGSELRYTGPDAVERRIRLNGLNIEYFEPASLGNGGWEAIYSADGGVSDNTTSLTFTQSAESASILQIELILEKRVVERWHNASISTQITIRN